MIDTGSVKRQVRVVAILHHCRHAGISPVDGSQLHVIAYLCDVLAPVWGLPFLSGRLLKTKSSPMFPALQRDVDRLVGIGVVVPTAVGYSRGRRIFSPETTQYSLSELAGALVFRITTDAEQAKQFQFIREVVLALSSVAANELDDVGQADFSYSDPRIDYNGMVDFAAGNNAGLALTQKFRELALPEEHLSNTQLVHLYVRHLYRSLGATA